MFKFDLLPSMNSRELKRGERGSIDAKRPDFDPTVFFYIACAERAEKH